MLSLVAVHGARADGKVWVDPGRGCGHAAAFLKSGKVADLPGCSGKLPKDAPGRTVAIDTALLGAAQPPLTTARAAARLIALATEIARTGNKSARSDALVAEALARAALAGALANVRVNVAALSEPARGKELVLEAEQLSARP